MKDLNPHDVMEFDDCRWMVTAGGTSIVKITNDGAEMQMYQLGGSEKKEVLVWGSKKLQSTTGYEWDDRETTIWISEL